MRYQSGQAALESIIVVILFLLLMLASKLLLQAQEGKQDLFSSSLAFAVSAARGATLNGASIHGVHDQKSQMNKDLENKLMNELGMMDDKWIRSNQEMALYIPKVLTISNHLGHIKIRDSAYVKGNISHAGGPEEVASQLKHSKNIWASPASQTEILVRYTIDSSHLVDMAWKRKIPKIDLLKGWIDAEPFK